MHQNLKTRGQAGFSLYELLIVMAILVFVLAGTGTLLKSSLSISTATYELTDAQESLRAAQEYIQRDLMNAGDGLKSMTYIPVNTTFVQNFLSRTPIADAAMPSGATNLGILTTDNNLPGGTTTPAQRPSPSPSPMPSPTPLTLLAGTDRQTIMEIDPDLVSNPQIFPTTISTAGDYMILPPATTTAQMNTFTAGEIYFLTSMRGGTFATLTSVDVANKKLYFSNGDYCGLNNNGSNNRIKDISSNGTLPTTLQRMRIIQYFVDSNKLLRRRVFGERGTPYRDNIIAEHVLSVQFVYSLGLDSNGNPLQPTDLLTTPVQQVNISQVEVTVTVETPHKLEKGAQPYLSTTTATSLRNMQFRQALQPAPTPTPSP